MTRVDSGRTNEYATVPVNNCSAAGAEPLLGQGLTLCSSQAYQASSNCVMPVPVSWGLRGAQLKFCARASQCRAIHKLRADAGGQFGQETALVFPLQLQLPTRRCRMKFKNECN